MANAIELKSLTDKELSELKQDLEKELVERAKRAREEAKRAAEEAAKKYGFSLDEILGDGKKKSASPRKPAAPKYRNPNNPEQTWSGRGRQPDWYKEAVDAGTAPEAMLI